MPDDMTPDDTIAEGAKPDDDTGAGPGVRALSANEAAPLLRDPATIVLDIRTPEEVAQARLPGKLFHLDFHAADFARKLGALDPDARYLMYCRSGQRSATARRLMVQLGFTDVVDLAGGLVGWANAGLPMETGPGR